MVVNFEYAQMDDIVIMTMAEMAELGELLSTDALWFITNTTIDDYSEWQSTTNLYFPNLTEVGASAFKDCTSLVSVYAPEETTLGNSAFKKCSDLTYVKLPKVTNLSVVDYTIEP